jgi:hypothetical protein
MQINKGKIKSKLTFAIFVKSRNIRSLLMAAFEVPPFGR